MTIISLFKVFCTAYVFFLFSLFNCGMVNDIFLVCAIVLQGTLLFVPTTAFLGWCFWFWIADLCIVALNYAFLHFSCKSRTV